VVVDTEEYSCGYAVGRVLAVFGGEGCDYEGGVCEGLGVGGGDGGGERGGCECGEDDG